MKTESMQELRCFNPSPLPIQIFADVTLQLKIWQFEFLVLDPGNQIHWPHYQPDFEKSPSILTNEGKDQLRSVSHFFSGKASYERQNSLWQSTCLEVFVQPQHQNHYWEFNFSPSTLWNCYKFGSYRNPQIPLEDKNFDLLDMSFDGERLNIELEPAVHFAKTASFDVGLCAVIEDKHKLKTYWALSHSQEKPDFHHTAGFSMTKEIV